MAEAHSPLRLYEGDAVTRPIPKLLVSPEEAADVLSIGRTRVYRLIAAGELRSILIGRSRRIPASALVEFVRRLEAEMPRNRHRCRE